MCLLYLMSLYGLFTQLKITNLFDITANSLSIVALFGFSFSKKILVASFWKNAFVLCILIELVMGITDLMEGNSLPQLMLYVIFTILFVLPIYWAFFLYAFKKSKLWQ